MLYVHAGLPHRGDLAHWIAKDSRNRPFVVDEFDLSLDDSLGEERWEELLHDLQEGHYNLLFLSPPSSTFGRSRFLRLRGRRLFEMIVGRPGSHGCEGHLRLRQIGALCKSNVL